MQTCQDGERRLKHGCDEVTHGKLMRSSAQKAFSDMQPKEEEMKHRIQQATNWLNGPDKCCRRGTKDLWEKMATILMRVLVF